MHVCGGGVGRGWRRGSVSFHLKTSKIGEGDREMDDCSIWVCVCVCVYFSECVRVCYRQKMERV